MWLELYLRACRTKSKKTLENFMFLLFFTSLGTHLRSKEFWQVFLGFVPIQTHRAV